MTPRAIQWIISLCAVLLGFAFYYSLMPNLQSAARHKAMTLDLGIVVAGWFCLCMFGMIEMGALLSRWLRRRK